MIIKESLLIKFNRYKLEIILLFVSSLFLFYKLTYFPPFGDELAYIHWGWILKNGGTYFGYYDAVPPLFSYLISVALKIVSDPLQAGRIISSASGLFGAIGIYFLAKRLYGKTAACISGIFYVVSPFTFFYHRMAMRESLMLSIGVFVLLFSVYLVLNKNPKRNKFFALGLAISLALSLLTKQHAGFFVAFPFLALLLAQKDKLIAKLAWIAFSYSIAAAAFALVLLTQENAERMISFAAQMLTTAPPTGLNGEILVTSVYKYIGLVFLMPAVFLLLNFFRQKKYFEISLFLYPVILFIILLIPPWLDTRYVLTAILPWYLFVGAMVRYFIEVINNAVGLRRIGFAVLVAALFIPSAHFIINYSNDPTSTPFTRYDRGFLESGNSSYGVIESLNYLKELSDKSPIMVVTEPGSGPKNWPFLFFENNARVKVVSWPGFREVALSPYISEAAYVMLDDDPKTGGHYYFKKVNPGAKLLKRFWRPGKKTYVDLMMVQPKGRI